MDPVNSREVFLLAVGGEGKGGGTRDMDDSALNPFEEFWRFPEVKIQK